MKVKIIVLVLVKVSAKLSYVKFFFGPLWLSLHVELKNASLIQADRPMSKLIFVFKTTHAYVLFYIVSVNRILDSV